MEIGPLGPAGMEVAKSKHAAFLHLFRWEFYLAAEQEPGPPGNGLDHFEAASLLLIRKETSK